MLYFPETCFGLENERALLKLQLAALGARSAVLPHAQSLPEIPCSSFRACVEWVSQRARRVFARGISR
jgi:hypothetical protein